MVYLIINMVIKTLKNLRIFPSMTGLVVMLFNVFYDLRIFLLFFTILNCLAAHMFMVIGLGNDYDYVEEEYAIARLLKAGRSSSTGNTGGGAADHDDEIAPSNIPGFLIGGEYQHIGLHAGTIFDTFRISIGDFSSIDTSASLTGADNWMFWIIWVFVMGATCIVFLNFIVAEASASYAKVTETLDEIIW